MSTFSIVNFKNSRYLVANALPIPYTFPFPIIVAKEEIES